VGGGGLTAAKQVGGGEETAASWSRGHRRGPSGWGGTMAVEWRSSRGHRQGGLGSSRRRCGARGGDRRFGGGPGGISWQLNGGGTIA
jgi:hypothetical protein